MNGLAHWGWLTTFLRLRFSSLRTNGRGPRRTCPLGMAYPRPPILTFPQRGEGTLWGGPSPPLEDFVGWAFPPAGGLCGVGLPPRWGTLWGGPSPPPGDFVGWAFPPLGDFVGWAFLGLEGAGGSSFLPQGAQRSRSLGTGAVPASGGLRLGCPTDEDWGQSLLSTVRLEAGGPVSGT